MWRYPAVCIPTSRTVCSTGGEAGRLNGGRCAYFAVTDGAAAAQGFVFYGGVEGVAIIKVVITRIFQDARHFLFQRLNNGHVVFPLQYWVGRPSSEDAQSLELATAFFKISKSNKMS